jgi:phage minor structural protein
MIILFNDTATDFTTLGLKVLQPLYAVVRKEDNGDYYLDLRDTSVNAHLYIRDYIIAVDTPWGRQGFRVATSKVKGTKVDIKAYHLFYDSKGYLIEDSYVVVNDANYALDHLNTATDQTSPFTTISDVTTTTSLRIVRKDLYTAVLSVVDRWGGHLDLDNWDIGLRTVIGQDRGVTIAYGKNITDYAIGDNWDDVCTKVLPVGKDGLQLDDVYVENNPTDYPKPYSKVVSFNQNDVDPDAYRDDAGVLDETAYTDALKSDLLAQATTYLAENHYPKVNYSFSAFIEGITDIGDVIRVNHPRLTVPLETNVIAIEYNAIAERVDKVEFGNFNPKLSNLVNNTQSAIDTATEQVQAGVTSAFNSALQDATLAINGILGNSYVIYDGDEILVVDALPKEDATNVMRINSGGIGFSTSGIGGTFTSAWQIDGTLDMQQINVINLVADRIKGGSLRLGFYEGNNGLIELYDEFGNEVGQIDQDGIVLTNPNGDRLEISPVNGLSAFSTISGTEQEVFSIDRDVTDIAKLNAREQIQMTPIKIVPIPTGTQAGWAFVKLDEA